MIVHLNINELLIRLSAYRGRKEHSFLIAQLVAVPIAVNFYWFMTVLHKNKRALLLKVNFALYHVRFAWHSRWDVCAYSTVLEEILCN